ncbi:MAG: small multi-drug export protein [Thermosphaera sp.]
MADAILTHLLISVLLGFLPISEVRGAIPYALVVGDGNMHIMGIYILGGVLANLSIAPIALNILALVERIIMSNRFPRRIRRIYFKIVETAMKKAQRMEKVTFISLILFVGIPLPVTGAWTGSLIAFLLRMDKKKAILGISLGVVIASFIVFIVSYLGISILKALFII